MFFKLDSNPHALMDSTYVSSTTATSVVPLRVNRVLAKVVVKKSDSLEEQ